MTFDSQAGSVAADAKRLLAPLRNDILQLTAALVHAKSVNVPPQGTETAGQTVLRDFFAAHRIQSELYALDFLGASGHPLVRTDRDYRGRKNLSVRLPGSGRGKSLLLNGHMDTVPPGKAAWARDPWSGDTHEGRLYGLGSFDMKAGVAAQAGVAAAVQRAGVPLAGDLLLQSVVDEEWGGGGGTLAAMLRGERADAAVVSEGTQLEILRATRGGFVVDLEVQAGDPAAYFSEHALVSPAVPLGRLLQWVDDWTMRRAVLKAKGAYGSVPDPAPVQVLAIEANRLDRDVPLSVPLRGAVRVYFQFVPEEDVPAVLQTVRQSLDEFCLSDAFFREHPVDWKPFYDPPLLGHELPETHPWTQCLAAAAGGVCGKQPRISAAPYPCDAFLLQREFGIPTLLFGPAGGGAHNPDEYVDVESILLTAESLLAATLLWCA